MKRLLPLLLAIAPCFASITYDATTQSAVVAGSPASAMNTLTVGCSNATVVVFVSRIFGTAASVTVNGSGASAVSGSPYQNPVGMQYIDAFVATGIASGSTPIVATNNGSATNFGFIAASYCGSTGVDTLGTGFSVFTSIAIGSTTTTPHDWGVIFVSGASSSTYSAGSGATQRNYITGSGLNMFFGDSGGELSPPPGPAAYSLAVNFTGAPSPWGWFIALSPVVTNPTVTTTGATLITDATAVSGGNVTDNGAGTVTARGVCYATTSNPTSPCTSNGSGLGVFTSNITGLTPSTLYHYRAFATNSAGTAYGTDLTFSTNATAAPTNIQISQVSNTQATLTFDTPNKNVCPLQVSESATLSPLVPDVDPGIFTNADQANRTGNINVGYHWQFIIGKRTQELGTVGTNTGHYFSRALEANTLHYWALNCPGGQATGTFNTKATTSGNTFAEPFQGDPATPGASPYPYLDPTVRNSFFIDPQTGLRHTAVTAANDFPGIFNNQAYTDAADINGATWSNPTNVYMSSMPTTATTGVGNLWIGMRTTQSPSGFDSNSWSSGPSYDYLLSNGSISNYQVAITASVASGTDTLVWCLSVDRATCATPAQNLSITSTPAAYTLGTFPSGIPNGTNGGSGADPVLFNATPPINRWNLYAHTGTVLSDGAGNIAYSTVTRIWSSSLSTGGMGYAPGDTFTVNGGTAAGVVDTVSTGVVATYHLTSNGGPTYKSGGGATTATSGIGSGLVLNISAGLNGNYFIDEWGSSSIIRLSTVSVSDACAAGTTYNISTLNSGTSMSVTGGTPAAGSFFYCATNFGILIHRQTPDSRTVTLENASFNLILSQGPIWFSGTVFWAPSKVKLSGGYYFVSPPSTGPLGLYHFNTTTQVSTLIGFLKANSNAGTDGWNASQQPGLGSWPFDDTASQSTGHLVLYEQGPDLNNKQVIIRIELSGTPAYQLGQAGTPGFALMDQTLPACAPTTPDAFSTQVICHGMTAKFTNITPASLNKDLITQFTSVPGYSIISAYPEAHVFIAGVANGYIILEYRGQPNTLALYARLNPATGLIDNFSNSYSQTNCRWCTDHSGAQVLGDVNFMLFGLDTVGSFPNSSENGFGPWIATSNTAIAASPSVICPTNSIGAPTTGTACDVITINSHGGANPFEPYNPGPGPQESDFLQTAQPGDNLCVEADAGGGFISPHSCSYFGSEIMVLVSKSGSLWTVWRPGNLNIAPGNCSSQPPGGGNCWVAIPGSGTKNLFMWCTGRGAAVDSNGLTEGASQGGPMWDTTTGGSSAVWYTDHYYLGGHAQGQFNQTVNGTNIPGQFAEDGLESLFCGIPGMDTATDCYRLRTAPIPAVANTPPFFANTLSVFAGAVGNDNSVGAGSSHLGIGGLVNSFVDDRPWTGDALGITPTLVGGTTHVYSLGTVALSRKQLQTGAVAGNHTLKDISSTATGDQITDSTDMSYCVTLFANECRTGSTVGQVYVSASQRTYLGCYGGTSIIDVYAPGGNVQQDICVFPAGNNVNPIVQVGFTSDPAGYRYGSVLSFLSNGKNKMANLFANVHVFNDSSYYLANEQWGSLFGTQVTAVSMPPPGLPTDSVLRSSFIPVVLSIKAASGADGLLIKYGYGEYGSATQFYCTSRQESCEANQASVNSAAPFSFVSENPMPLACTSGTCKIVIPGLPGHLVLYQIVRTLSGTPVATSATMTAVVP